MFSNLFYPSSVLSGTFFFSAGLRHGEQTSTEGRSHRPEWNSAHRGHSGARSAGGPQQVGDDGRETYPRFRARRLPVTAGCWCFCARRLRQVPVAIKFVTNTTKESKRNLLARLQRLNFSVQVQLPRIRLKRNE